MESKLRLLSLGKTKLEGAYLLKSQDSYVYELCLKQILNQIKLEYKDINMAVFDEENFNPSEIVSSCMQLPFLDEKRLVVLKNVKKKDEQIQKYIESQNPTTLLLIVSTEANYSSCTEIISTFTESEKQSMIFAKLKKKNKKITKLACNKLIEKCEDNISKLNNELQKLVYYCEGEVVDEVDVDTIVKANQNYQVFTLINAISQKDSTKAQKIIKFMFDSKEDIAGIMSLIYSNFRRMFFAKSNDKPNEELAKELGVKPYAITKAKENAKNFPVKKLKQIITLCEEVDYKIKNGEMPLNNGFYYLIFNIISN